MPVTDYLDKSLLCQFFASNECTRGNACKFAHSLEELTHIPEQDRRSSIIGVPKNVRMFTRAKYLQRRPCAVVARLQKNTQEVSNRARGLLLGQEPLPSRKWTKRKAYFLTRLPNWDLFGDIWKSSWGGQMYGFLFSVSCLLSQN